MNWLGLVSTHNEKNLILLLFSFVSKEREREKDVIISECRSLRWNKSSKICKISIMARGFDLLCLDSRWMCGSCESKRKQNFFMNIEM